MRKNLFKESLKVQHVDYKPKNSYQRVQANLAVTPAQMFEMAAHGVPISLQNAANFNDGDTNPSWTVAPERLRGVDMADLWQMQQSSRAKLKKARADAKAAAAAESSES